MNENPRLNDDERDDLVAYLDGELDEDAARQMESRLSRDPAARQEAEALQQAWDLLDYLPRPEASASFTHRTLDRVSALRASRSRPLPRKRWLSPVGWVALLVLAGCVGYAAAPHLPANWSPFVPDGAARERSGELLSRAEREQQRKDWQVAVRYWDDLLEEVPLPCRFEDFPPEVKEYYDSVLKRFLSPAEREQLRQAEGQWPTFPRTLIELADRHPLTLPGPVGPLRLEELQTDVQRRILNLKGADKGSEKGVNPRLESAEGKWPDFGIQLLYLYHRNKGLTVLSPLETPSHPTDFSPAIQQFIETKLADPADQAKLKGVEGKWPEYPQVLLQLAKDRGLEVPGMRLPGPKEFWDKYRVPPAAP